MKLKSRTVAWLDDLVINWVRLNSCHLVIASGDRILNMISIEHDVGNRAVRLTRFAQLDLIRIGWR